MRAEKFSSGSTVLRGSVAGYEEIAGEGYTLIVFDDIRHDARRKARKMAVKFRLRCTSCGHTRTAETRDRRCKQIVERVYGLNKPRREYCYGTLVRVKPEKKLQSDLDKAAHCQTMIDLAGTRLKRATTLLDKWTKRKAYYLKKAAGLIKQRVPVRKPKADRHTRSIELEQ